MPLASARSIDKPTAAWRALCGLGCGLLLLWSLIAPAQGQPLAADGADGLPALSPVVPIASSVPSAPSGDDLVAKALALSEALIQRNSNPLVRLMTADYCGPRSAVGQQSGAGSFLSSRGASDGCTGPAAADLLRQLALAYQRDVAGQRLTGSRTLLQLRQERQAREALRNELETSQAALAAAQAALEQVRREQAQGAVDRQALIEQLDRLTAAYIQLSAELDAGANLVRSTYGVD